MHNVVNDERKSFHAETLTQTCSMEVLLLYLQLISFDSFQCICILLQRRGNFRRDQLLDYLCRPSGKCRRIYQSWKLRHDRLEEFSIGYPLEEIVLLALLLHYGSCLVRKYAEAY